MLDVQGLAPPLTATGLLQHETKLTVLHFGLRKSAAFSAPLPNKAPLLLVTGIRCAIFLISFCFLLPSHISLTPICPCHCSCHLTQVCPALHGGSCDILKCWFCWDAAGHWRQVHA